MDKFAIMFICALFTFLILMLYCVLNYKPAKAEPVITEVPEYIMKATKCGMYTCTEYTIYRITRN